MAEMDVESNYYSRYYHCSFCSYFFSEAAMQNKKTALFTTIVALFLIPLISSRQIYSFFDLPKTIALYVMAATLVTLYFSGGPAARRHGRLAKYLVWYFVWLAVAALISPNFSLAFFGGYNRYEGFFFFVASGFFFFIGDWLKESKRTLVMMMMLVGAVVGIVAAYEFWYGFWPNSRSCSTFGNPMILGTYFALIIPVTIGYLFAVENPWLKRLSLLCLYLILLGTVFSFSRGGWGGAALTTLIWVVFCFKKIVRQPRTSLWLGLVVILAVGSSLLLIKYQHFSNPQRLRQMATQLAVDPVRFDLIRAALKVFRDHPVTGVGLNGLATTITRYLPLSLVQVNLNYDLVHNDLVHTLTTQGIPGFLVYLGFLFLLVRNWHNWYKSGTRCVLDAAIWAAIIGHLIVIQFSFPWVGYTFIFWLLIGLVNPEFPTENNDAKIFLPQPFKIGVACLLLLTALGYGCLAYAADWQFCQGYLHRQDLQKQEHYLTKAIQYAPWEPEYRFIRAQNAFLIMNRRQAPKTELRRMSKRLTQEAFFLLERDLNNFRYYSLIGDAFGFYEKYDQAAAHYQKALELYPNYYPLYVTLGSLMVQSQHFDQAEGYFQKVLQLKPGYQPALVKLKLLKQLRREVKR
jgi:O-antigen ligase